jgi:hypothetical protein
MKSRNVLSSTRNRLIFFRNFVGVDAKRIRTRLPTQAFKFEALAGFDHLTFSTLVPEKDLLTSPVFVDSISFFDKAAGKIDLYPRKAKPHRHDLPKTNIFGVLPFNYKRS